MAAARLANAGIVVRLNANLSPIDQWASKEWRYLNHYEAAAGRRRRGIYVAGLGVVYAVSVS